MQRYLFIEQIIQPNQMHFEGSDSIIYSTKSNYYDYFNYNDYNLRRFVFFGYLIIIPKNTHHAYFHFSFLKETQILYSIY